MFLKDPMRFAFVAFTLYVSQNLFFISTAAYLSQQEDALLNLGNLLLLAMVPFFISGLFLAPRLDRISTRSQMVTIKLCRAVMILGAGYSITLGWDVLYAVYANVLVYDLGFYLFFSTSAQASKELNCVLSVKSLESIGLLATQCGMICGGLLAGILMSYFSLGGLFIICGLIELIGIYWALQYGASKPYGDGGRAKSLWSSFRVSLLLCRKRPYIVLLILAFALVLPVIQILNLISGPFFEVVVHDGGRVLAWMSAATAAGACLASLLLLGKSYFRDQKILLFSPLLIAIAALTFFYSRVDYIFVISGAIFGVGYAWARITVRAALIDRLEHGHVGELTTVGTWFSVLISILVVIFLQYNFTAHLTYGFVLIALLAGLQCWSLVVGAQSTRATSNRGIRTE